MPFKRIQLFLLWLVCGLLFAVSCRDSTSPEIKPHPPKLPPVKSLQMNVSVFSSQSSSALRAGSASDSTSLGYGNFGKNFIQSFDVMAPAIIVESGLAVPRYLVKRAKQHDPKRNDDGKWTWKYSFSFAGFTVSSRLVASRNDDGSVSWKFYQSNSLLETQNRLALSGTSNADNTKGTWISYFSGFGAKHKRPQKYARVKWTTLKNHDVALRIKLLGSVLGAHQGDHFKYYADGPIEHTRYFKNGSDEPIIIQWNVKSLVGFIIDPDFNGGNKACWGADLQNIPCADI